MGVRYRVRGFGSGRSRLLLCTVAVYGNLGREVSHSSMLGAASFQYIANILLLTQPGSTDTANYFEGYGHCPRAVLNLIN